MNDPSLQQTCCYNYIELRKIHVTSISMESIITLLLHQLRNIGVCLLDALTGYHILEQTLFCSYFMCGTPNGFTESSVCRAAAD